MENKKKITFFFRLPEDYLNSLDSKALWQLPYIVRGSAVFLFTFLLMGIVLLVAGRNMFLSIQVLGGLCIFTSAFFLATFIMISKLELYKGVSLSTFGIVLASFIIVCGCPVSENSLVYYRSGCFVAVMAVCNQLVTLKRRQLFIFFCGSLVAWFFSLFRMIPASIGFDRPGTISAVIINTIAIVIANVVIMNLNKFNSKIISSAENSEEKARENLGAITKMIDESKTGLDVGKRLYAETQKAGRSISELNGIYSEISEDAKDLSTNTEKISDSSNQIRDRAFQMKQSVLEQNASIDETSKELMAMSMNLSELSGIAEQRSQNMKQMLDTLESEIDLIRTVVEQVNQVQTSSEGIAGFVKTVDDIAQQTGVLAMNASIEAAHAGEAGKGFSVIAQEIRKFSVETTTNAKQIADELNKNLEIVHGTTDSVKGFDAYVQKTAEEMRSTIELISRILQGILGVNNDTRRIMSSLQAVVQKTSDTEIVVDSVVNEINQQNETLSKISSFADQLRQNVDGMDSQLNGIKNVIAAIEAEAQANIEVSKKISATL